MRVRGSVRAVHSVEVSRGDAAADHELMTAPGVVGSDRGARTCRIHGSGEIAHRELSYLVLKPLRDHFVVERPHCLAELDQEIAMPSELIVVRVETAYLNEEHLTIDVQIRSLPDQTGDLSELVSDPGCGKSRGVIRVGLENRIRRHSGIRYVARRRLQIMREIDGAKVIERCADSARVCVGAQRVQHGRQCSRTDRERQSRLSGGEQLSPGNGRDHRNQSHRIIRSCPHIGEPTTPPGEGFRIASAALVL